MCLGHKQGITESATSWERFMIVVHLQGLLQIYRARIGRDNWDQQTESGTGASHIMAYHVDFDMKLLDVQYYEISHKLSSGSHLSHVDAKGVASFYCNIILSHYKDIIPCSLAVTFSVGPCRFIILRSQK